MLLYDLVNSKLQESLSFDKSLDVKHILSDDKSCKHFIESILNAKVFDEDSYETEITQARAAHSATTFLFGLISCDSFVFFDKICNAAYSNNENKHEKSLRLWTLTALYHDIGYFRSAISNDENFFNNVNYDLFKEVYEEQLLKDINNFSTHYPQNYAYTCEEIKSYNQYAYEFHSKKNDSEKWDHGILGAVILFDELIRKQLKHKEAVNRYDNREIKSICMNIAQHNIFKSPDVKTDRQYMKYSLDKLTSSSNFRIGKDTPLLLFLSLIDTIECVKRFGKAYDKTKYLQAETVLKHIDVKMSKEKISIDFSQLRKYIITKRKGDNALIDNLDRHINNIEALKTWTVFNINREKGSDLITISC